MSKVNQIIMKAFSSDSEDEAISCFLMARKQYKKEPTDVSLESSQKFNDKTAKEWYDVAAKLSKLYSVGLDRMQNVDTSMLKLYDEIRDIRKRNVELETKNFKIHVNYILGFIFIASMITIIFI